MNLEKLEQAVRDIVVDIDREEFIYQLLRAYDLPKASITRLKNGQYNQSKNDGEVLWKKKLCFRHEAEEDLHECIDRLKSEKRVAKRAPRFVVVTDFERILAFDTKTNDSLETLIKDLPKHSVFFLPWANLEKEQVKRGNAADERAAEKMGQLYEIIAVENEVETQEQRHALNIFLSRLLFCFFAEDTEIFASDQFTNAVASHTSEDGSDLQGYLQKLFMVLATEDRSSFPQFLQAFPYVNGGLFCEDYPVPIFNRKSRKIIIECGSLDWKAINPDIFGSMIQAVVHSEERGQMGMHYTSVVNIMKVIEPLFLNELKEELDAAGTSKKKLDALLKRLYNLRIFDPACGSGNFLIIAYKELCRLEIEVFDRLGRSGKAVQMDLFRSNLQLTQFYGIELDGFAHETAKLSLWLAEHQMNLEFKKVFGATRPTLPLQEGGNVVCDNATRLDWEEVCPKKDGEVFVLGNPPYLGQGMQSVVQKEDMALVFEGITNFKLLDYISCWFLKAADYVDTRFRFAFVTTNSICQGSQVELIWPHIFNRNLEIYFANKNFSWTNNAKGKAGVICSVVGIRPVCDEPKHFFGERERIATNINAYLIDAQNVIVRKSNKSLFGLPAMKFGNSPRDGGYLILSKTEYEELILARPTAGQFIKKFVGSSDFIRGVERYCIWIGDDKVEAASKIPEISQRMESVRSFRLSGGKNARNKANVPHRFEIAIEPKNSQIIVPRTSSSRRRYIPVGFLDKDSVIADSAQAIYDPDAYVLGVVSSRLHMVWVAVTSGRLKSDFRYSSYYSYYTFPVPQLGARQKTAIEENVYNVLDLREAFPELTLADLYDPDKMPDSLREAHHQMDLAVERCYRKKPFSNDEERLEYLFKLYETMITEEKKTQ